MNQNHNIYLNDEMFVYEESIPKWVFELRKEHQEAMSQLTAKFVAMTNELKERNDKLDSIYAEMKSINAEIKLVHNKIESDSSKREEAIKELEVLYKIMDETEEFRDETDKYWEDRINEEIRKRSVTSCRDACTSKSSRKRINNNGQDVEHVEKKKKIQF